MGVLGSKSVVLDSNGAGTVRLGPSNLNQVWAVDGASVKVSSNTAEPTANLYQGSRDHFLGGTFTGSNDTTDLNVELRKGTILCEWAGGDVGATATLTLTGEQRSWGSITR